MWFGLSLAVQGSPWIGPITISMTAVIGECHWQNGTTCLMRGLLLVLSACSVVFHHMWSGTLTCTPREPQLPSYMYRLWTALRPRCWTVCNALDAFRPIPGLISCIEATRSIGVGSQILLIGLTFISIQLHMYMYVYVLYIHVSGFCREGEGTPGFPPPEI